MIQSLLVERSWYQTVSGFYRKRVSALEDSEKRRGVRRFDHETHVTSSVV